MIGMATATKMTLAAELGIAVGDFFVMNWGYDQNNVDFYKVVGITPKGVKIQRWTSKNVGTDGYHDKVVPGDAPYMTWQWPDDFNGDPLTQRVLVPAKIEQKKLGHYTAYGENKVYLNMTSYANAYIWQGNAQYQTGAGYGH